MKIRITAIGKDDAYYDSREKMIGTTGEEVTIYNKRDGWTSLEMFNCQYPEGSKYEDGDRTSFYQIKYEIIEE